ncbi:MAG: hypothetical protein ABF917_08350, partial [Gluconobacter oxydans]
RSSDSHHIAQMGFELRCRAQRGIIHIAFSDDSRWKSDDIRSGKGLVFLLGLPLCPLFTSFNSIADIPLSPLICVSAQ